MRISVLKLILCLFFLAVLTRLFYWQIIMAAEMQSRAEGQHFENLKINASRGQILYRDGSILASSTPVYLLYGMPKSIGLDQKEKTSTALAKLLGGDKELELKVELVDKFSKDLYWIPLIKNISTEDKKKIEQLNLSGVGFEEGNNRLYPEGSSSAHLLGFVGSDSKGDQTGYFGVEGFYNGELKGLTGNILQEKDAFGIPLLIGRFFSRGGKDGKDLTLNIDRTVQFFVEQSLKKGIEKYGAKGASAIVMDPKSGEVLALASYPNYDPASFDQFSKNLYKNPVVADAYEPGSTFKVLVMAAAVNEGLVKAETECDICSEPVSISGFSIRTWNNKYYPNTTMKDVIVHSDNTGMVFTGKKLGLDKFYEYLEKFGFGQLTNIDLQDESAPDLRSKESWREIDLATASFGQGIAVTAMQMIRAVSTIANGGYLIEPKIVRTISNDQDSFEIKPKVVRQVISEATSKVITEMMVAAVEEGEAKFLKPKGFKVAGKTGTAQIPVAGHYDPNKTIASFVGFAPADNPRFIMLVRYDQPTSSIYGSETAAPTFFEISKELFNYFKIVPTEL